MAGSNNRASRGSGGRFPPGGGSQPGSAPSLGPKGEKGSDAVVLADGLGLHVASTTLAVQVDEITDPGRHPNWAKLLPLVIPIHKLNAGAIKIFNISSNSLLGWDVAKVPLGKSTDVEGSNRETERQN